MVDDKLGKLADSVDRMTQAMSVGDGAENSATVAMERVAEGQQRLIEFLEAQGGGDGIDAESRMRLRSIDVQMLRILEEISAGRQETMTEIRTDLAALIRTMDNSGETERQSEAQRLVQGMSQGRKSSGNS